MKIEDPSLAKFDSPSRNQQNSKSYISPSQASLGAGLNKINALQDDGNPKPRKDFLPGHGHQVTKTMKQVNNIIASAKRAQDRNYGLMQLAG